MLIMLVSLWRIQRGAGIDVTEHPLALGELAVRGFSPTLMGVMQFKMLYRSGGERVLLDPHTTLQALSEGPWNIDFDNIIL